MAAERNGHDIALHMKTIELARKKLTVGSLVLLTMLKGLGEVGIVVGMSLNALGHLGVVDVLTSANGIERWHYTSMRRLC